MTVEGTARVHPTSVVAEGARIGADSEIGPFSVVGSDVVIGRGVTIKIACRCDRVYGSRRRHGRFSIRMRRRSASGPEVQGRKNPTDCRPAQSYSRGSNAECRH